MTDILLINPNTTASITELVLKTARRFASKGTSLLRPRRKAVFEEMGVPSWLTARVPLIHLPGVLPPLSASKLAIQIVLIIIAIR